LTLAFWFSATVLVVSVAIYGEVRRGWQRLHQLRDVPPMLPAHAPKVSIVVAARNEERAIEAAARSLLALEYPSLEILVVDDRSTDRTGEILDRLHAEDPRLAVAHVRVLPAGWIGKNHALHAGACEATGDYLLFTDADVVYEPSAIARAVAHCEARRLDHLTVVPDVQSKSLFVQFNVMGGFAGLLAMHRPWRAEKTGTHGLGVGAFNLVRRDAYRAAGGHETLRLDILDDIELGRLMGEGGRRQDLLLAHDMIHIEMYASAAEMISGIQKNVFTFMEYNVLGLVAATLVTFVTYVWPWLGILVTEGATRWINVASAATVAALYFFLARRFGYSRWCLAYLPLSGVISIALFWQIAIRTWIQGGVVWRGTFYPLRELKAAHRGRYFSAGVKARRAPTDR
jgi:glycosyltransferase involved in cell wall biosynthesis